MKAKRILLSSAIVTVIILSSLQAVSASENDYIPSMVVKKAYELATGKQCLDEDLDCWDIGLKICEECNLLHNQYTENLSNGGAGAKGGSVLGKISSVAGGISGSPGEIIHSIAWLCVIEKFVFDAIGGKSQSLETMHGNFEAMFGNFDTINFAIPNCNNNELNGFNNPVSECSLGGTTAPNGPIGPRPGPDMRGGAGGGGPSGAGIPTIMPDSMVGECGKIDPIHFKNSFASNEGENGGDDDWDNFEDDFEDGMEGEGDDSWDEGEHGEAPLVSVSATSNDDNSGGNGGNTPSALDDSLPNVGFFSAFKDVSEKAEGFFKGIPVLPSTNFSNKFGVSGKFTPAPHEDSEFGDLLSQCKNTISSFFAGCMGVGSQALKDSGVICTTLEDYDKYPYDSSLVPPTCSCGVGASGKGGAKGGGGQTGGRSGGTSGGDDLDGSGTEGGCGMTGTSTATYGNLSKETLTEMCQNGSIGEPIFSQLCGAIDPTPTASQPQNARLSNFSGPGNFEEPRANR